MPNLLTHKHVAIIGGGPGGLTLARLLQLNGVRTTVYERDINSHARDQGATLDLHEESGLKALEKAQLMNEFKQHYRPGADKVRLTNSRGEIQFDQHEDLHYAESRPEIDRAPLRQLLLDSLQPESIVWNAQVKSVSPQGDGWMIEFFEQSPAYTNLLPAYADLVIGADGANSMLRSRVTSTKPEFVGLTVLESCVYDSDFAVPELHELVKGGKIFALGNNQSLILSAKGDVSLTFYIGFKSEEDWQDFTGIHGSDRAAVRNWFNQEFPAWAGFWDGLFINASTPFIVRPQYCVPLNQHWQAQKNITLIGDAAHVMPPYAGEGVNMAMLDALELSECLTEKPFDDLQSAITCYETTMLKRAASTAKITLDSMELLHSPDALSFMTSILQPTHIHS